MKRKNIFLMAIVLVFALTLTACEKKEQASSQNTEKTVAQESKTETAGENKDEQTQKAEETQELTLTLEELAKYNGKDGNPAYIAVDGIIYDVTNSPAWKNGGHNGFEAGADLSDAIKNKSPHGVSKLESMPIVGKLAK